MKLKSVLERSELPISITSLGLSALSLFSLPQSRIVFSAVLVTAAALAISVKSFRNAAVCVLGLSLILALQIPILQIWPVYLLLPLCAYVVLGRFEYGWRRQIGILIGAAGVSVKEVLLSVLLGCFCGVAVFVWFKVARPDISGQVSRLPNVSLVGLSVLALLFALLNSFIEEFIWRGVVQTHLEAVGLPKLMLLLVQAAHFGIFHYAGMPGGKVGVFLAFLFGILAGLLRFIGRGLVLSIVAHFVADVFIFTIYIAAKFSA